MKKYPHLKAAKLQSRAGQSNGLTVSMETKWSGMMSESMIWKNFQESPFAGPQSSWML